MTLVLSLILLPFLAGLLLLGVNAEWPRRAVVVTVITAICAGSIALACLPAPLVLGDLPVSRHGIDLGITVAELLMGIYIVFVGLRARHFLIVALMLAQGGVMGWFEWAGTINVITQPA